MTHASLSLHFIYLFILFFLYFLNAILKMRWWLSVCAAATPLGNTGHPDKKPQISFPCISERRVLVWALEGLLSRWLFIFLCRPHLWWFSAWDQRLIKRHLSFYPPSLYNKANLCGIIYAARTALHQLGEHKRKKGKKIHPYTGPILTNLFQCRVQGNHITLEMSKGGGSIVQVLNAKHFF